MKYIEMNLNERLATMGEDAQQKTAPLLHRAFGMALMILCFCQDDHVAFTDDQLREAWDVFLGTKEAFVQLGFCPDEASQLLVQVLEKMNDGSECFENFHRRVVGAFLRPHENN
jgi:hypothetical protein